MKTTFKVVLAAVLAVLLALGVRYIYLETAQIKVDGASPTTLYETAMLQAREMFVEKSDSIQLLTAALLEKEGLQLLRSAEGDVMTLSGGEAVPYEAPAAIAADLAAVFGDYQNGGKVFHIEVRGDAVLYFTYYYGGGCAGFLYEKALGETSYYNYLEIVENWKLFYDIPPE